jgi:hypothetical protein
MAQLQQHDSVFSAFMVNLSLEPSAFFGAPFFGAHAIFWQDLKHQKLQEKRKQMLAKRALPAAQEAQVNPLALAAKTPRTHHH